MQSAIKSCPWCGTLLPVNAVFCLQCGSKQTPSEPQVIKSAGKLYGKPVYCKDVRGATFEAVEECPICQRKTPMGRVNHPLQRPKFLLAGLFTFGLAWLALLLPTHTMVCRICGYKHN